MATTNKIEQYFSTMNSLAVRISSDIRNMEHYLVNSEDDSMSTLTYNEKCAAIDNYLIDDVIRQASSKFKSKGPQRTKSSTTNHLDSLILSVYPSKPEKYVFEETGGVWLDEHSAPFSFCKESQAKCCSLGKTLAQNLAEEKELLLNRNMESSSSAEERGEIPKRRDGNGLLPKNANSHHNRQYLPKNSADEIKQELVRKPAKPKQFFGINVMDFMEGQTKPTKLTAASQNQNLKDKPNEDDDNDDLQKAAEEDKLPQQKQNLQLIAELQAKLKRTNQIHDDSAAKSGSKDEDDKQNKIQKEKSTEKEQEVVKMKQKKSEKRLKVKKPKAPPPPPPPPKIDPPKLKQALTSVPKPKETVAGNQQQLTMTELKNVMAGIKQNKQPQITQKYRAPTVELQSQASISTDQGRPLKSNVAKPESNVTPANKVETKADFCVDVSSPCRIATPKTGLDFLDNW